VAYLNDLINVLPVKEKRIIKRTRWLYYLVVENKGDFYVRKRTGKDIWQNLYEFILIETPKPITIKKLITSEKFRSIFNLTEFTIQSISQLNKQQLTHQTINGQFINISIKTLLDINDHELVSKRRLKKLPFPKFITTYLKD